MDTMSQDDVLYTTTVDRATFFPIAVKPTDAGLLRMRECLTPILLVILYNTYDGANNLWGIHNEALRSEERR